MYQACEFTGPGSVPCLWVYQACSSRVKVGSSPEVIEGLVLAGCGGVEVVALVLSIVLVRYVCCPWGAGVSQVRACLPRECWGDTWRQTLAGLINVVTFVTARIGGKDFLTNT